jgi:Ca-activated chloride channel family protein
MIAYYRFYHTQKVVKLLAGKWSSIAVKNYSFIRSFLKVILISVGFFFLFLALLRPQGEAKENTAQEEGRDLLFALDVSRSMLATDSVPNRLEYAKKKIKKILSYLPCERVGLILFSGSAFVQCPLTNDYATFKMFLDQVDTETISSGSTALDQALAKGIETFTAMPNKKNKILIVITDGEDFSANLSSTKQKAAQEGVHIFALGVGSLEGAPIPLFDQENIWTGHQRDSNGAIVISRLNETLLRSLAADVGGTYVQMVDDDTDLTFIVNRVEQFEKEAWGERVYIRKEERYPYCVLVSFICFLIEWLL